MNEAARAVLREFKGHITMGFGESDEYSFLIDRDSTLYSRRQSKLVSHIVSIFTGAYVFHWSDYMGIPLSKPPSFDGRLVVYPSAKEVRDYFAWRQVDTHINNLYNTTFWALVLQGNQTEREAHETLKGTYSKDKHEILFQRFGINYDKLPALFRKGTTLVYSRILAPSRPINSKPKTELCTLHVDIIQDAFWQPAKGENSLTSAQNDTEIVDEDRQRSKCAGMGMHVLPTDTI
ncbi:tRNA(His) guanylyltransferase [Malassezia yamatoensis]|uniref:tRNA(His) guanylyltransferase n=1 Tax=Malassezia yamatoensis TaxID=253288 RepID=A0AAJ5YWQ1_9BASI|nr:tRNA(His) guanylyltransferase [Malassezia yamatoensis]